MKHHADEEIRSVLKTGSTSPKIIARFDRGRSFADVGAVTPFHGKMRQSLTAVRKPTGAFVSVNKISAVPSIRTSRTSDVLREILTKNPTVENFTVRQIVDAIGPRRVGTSLLFFSIPGMLRVPGTSKLSGLSVGLIAGQMIAGKTKIKLPQFMLRRSVPRRALAVAIHAVLPVLKIAEKLAKPRQRWVSHPAVRRILAVFIFLLALIIAVPILGFSAPYAFSIFVISFGLVERDGLAIVIGVIAGLASLVLLMGAGISGKTLWSMASNWGNKMIKNVGFKWVKNLGFKWVKNLGRKWAVNFFKRLGFKWAPLLLLDWNELLMLWDPEASFRRTNSKTLKGNAFQENRKRSAGRRSQKRTQPSALRPYLQAA